LSLKLGLVKLLLQNITMIRLIRSANYSTGVVVMALCRSIHWRSAKRVVTVIEERNRDKLKSLRTLRLFNFCGDGGDADASVSILTGTLVPRQD